MELVTVATFLNPIEYHIAKGLIDSENIKVFGVVEEASNIAYALYPMPLTVRARDSERAIALLKQAEFI